MLDSSESLIFLSAAEQAVAVNEMHKYTIQFLETNVSFSETNESHFQEARKIRVST